MSRAELDYLEEEEGVQIVEKQAREKEEVVEGVDDAQGDMEAEEQKCAVEDKE